MALGSMQAAPQSAKDIRGVPISYVDANAIDALEHAIEMALSLSR